MDSKQMALNIRKHAIHMTNASKGSHVACVLSVADIVAVLYAEEMKLFCDNPQHPERDRFILSKGHAGAAVYAALAEKGFFDTAELSTHYANGSRLSGHVSHNNLPGIEVSTGSLGNGLGVGAGMALAAKIDNKDYRTFVVLGDGECNEGSVWETAMFAYHNKLNNLCAIVDHNKMQCLGFCKDIVDMIDLAEKWRAFGWNVIVVNGHNHDELKAAFKSPSDLPKCIIANTIKGKGVSFMENDITWHYSYPKDQTFIDSLNELEGGY